MQELLVDSYMVYQVLHKSTEHATTFRAHQDARWVEVYCIMVQRIDTHLLYLGTL